jgi:hypothetical protein
MFLPLFRSNPSVLWQKTQLYKKPPQRCGGLFFSPVAGSAKK